MLTRDAAKLGVGPTVGEAGLQLEVETVCLRPWSPQLASRWSRQGDQQGTAQSVCCSPHTNDGRGGAVCGAHWCVLPPDFAPGSLVGRC